MAATYIILRACERTESEGTVTELVGNEFTLGRADACIVRPASDVVSRLHATVQVVDGVWVVMDLTSRNGTFLNDQRVETAELRVGDRIMLGEMGPVYELLAMEAGAGAEDQESTRFLRSAEPRSLTEPHGEEGAAPSLELESEPSPEPDTDSELEPEPVRAPEPEPEAPPPEPRAEPEPGPETVPSPVLEPEPPAPVLEDERSPAPAPVAAAAPAARAPQTPPPAPAKRCGFPWLSAAGLLFGILTGLTVWHDGFPYPALAAPGLWMTRGVVWWQPEWAAAKVGWLIPICLGVYWMLAGVALRRPVRRFSFLAFLAVCYAAAFFTLKWL